MAPSELLGDGLHSQCGCQEIFSSVQTFCINKPFNIEEHYIPDSVSECLSWVTLIC